jgi:hypothetical protein
MSSEQRTARETLQAVLVEMNAQVDALTHLPEAVKLTPAQVRAVQSLQNRMADWTDKYGEYNGDSIEEEFAAFAASLRAAPAPTAGDVIEDLVVALRSLAYAAMTSGGTKGPDAGLQDAIRWATDALQKYDVSAQANGAAPAPEGETCEWTDDPSGWQTGCGRDWQFIDDGPVENRMDYCMGCGKRVRVVASEGEQP